jgi:hypothetical protein
VMFSEWDNVTIFALTMYTSSMNGRPYPRNIHVVATSCRWTLRCTLPVLFGGRPAALKAGRSFEWDFPYLWWSCLLYFIPPPH